jgi:N-formylglutamate deformylase
MNSTYSLTSGNIGMLISMPHNGEKIPTQIANTMTSCGQGVADTDWYMDKLYDFANSMGIYTLIPKYSRYVIDLNRSPSGDALYIGADNTELCPTTTFDLSPIYLKNKQPTPQEITSRIEHYWQPYHQALNDTLMLLKKKYDRVVLLDAHSILSKVPRFFEGQLSDFNFGNADGTSCDQSLLEKIQQLDLSPYSTIYNGRFKGGYITRTYGDPKNNIHAIQLELSQNTYLDEPSNHYNEQKTEQVKKQLRTFVQCLADFAQQD